MKLLKLEVALGAPDKENVSCLMHDTRLVGPKIYKYKT